MTRLLVALWRWGRWAASRALRDLWTWNRRRRGRCVHRAMWRTPSGHWLCDICLLPVRRWHP